LKIDILIRQTLDIVGSTLNLHVRYLVSQPKVTAEIVFLK